MKPNLERMHFGERDRHETGLLTEKSHGVYRCLEIKVLGLQIKFDPVNIENLLQSTRSRTNQDICNSFDFGLRFMSAIDLDIDKVAYNPESTMPETIISLIMNKLKLSIDRNVLRHILKIKEFIEVGSWNKSLDRMLASIKDYSNQ